MLFMLSLAVSLNLDIILSIIKLSLVGVGMASNFGVASKVFTTLANNNVPFLHVSTSEISISCTINKENKAKEEDLPREKQRETRSKEERIQREEQREDLSKEQKIQG